MRVEIEKLTAAVLALTEELRQARVDLFSEERLSRPPLKKQTFVSDDRSTQKRHQDLTFAITSGPRPYSKGGGSFYSATLDGDKVELGASSQKLDRDLAIGEVIFAAVVAGKPSREGLPVYWLSAIKRSTPPAQKAPPPPPETQTATFVDDKDVPF